MTRALAALLAQQGSAAPLLAHCSQLPRRVTWCWQGAVLSSRLRMLPARCSALAAPAYAIESDHAFAGLEEDMVMEDFQDMLEAHSGIAPEDQDVLVGEPPRSLQVATLISTRC